MCEAVVQQSVFVFSLSASDKCLSHVTVRAQDDLIIGEIHPSRGASSTIILVRFSTRNASIGNVERARQLVETV